MTYYSEQKLKSEQEETFKRILKENPTMGEDLKALLEECLDYSNFAIITVSKKLFHHLQTKYKIDGLTEGSPEATFIFDDSEGLIGVVPYGNWHFKLVLNVNHTGSVETGFSDYLTTYSSTSVSMGLISLFENGNFTEAAIALASVIIYG